MQQAPPARQAIPVALLHGRGRARAGGRSGAAAEEALAPYLNFFQERGADASADVAMAATPSLGGSRRNRAQWQLI